MKSKQKKHRRHHLLRDLIIIGASVPGGIFLAQTGILENWISAATGSILIGSFVAGMFWTSAFFVVPASVAILEIARLNSILPVALMATAGAFFADLAVFRFFKDNLVEDIEDFFRHSRFHFHRLHFLWKLKSFRWLFSILGAIIIASPLPDDLGIAIMGLSHTNTHFFFITSLLLNFVGILTLILTFK